MVDIGDVERFGNYSGATNQDGTAAAAFANLAGVPTNPTTVTLVVQKPDGTQLTYGWPTAGSAGVLTNESPGRFYVDVPIDQSGKWQQRLSSTGLVQAASESSLRVQRQRVV